MEETAKDEIPDTETGLNLYLQYCHKQIKENRNHIKRLETRIEWVYEKAEKLKITLSEVNL